jgi:ApbE superfamily uncharacterized protein (UPF0280 family)
LAKSNKYEPRLYREAMGNPRWRSYRAEYLETDLWIAVDSGNYSVKAEEYSKYRIVYYRNILDKHIRDFPEFLTSLTPLAVQQEAHPLIVEMYHASGIAGTGPMSAVAGAVAEYICNDLISEFRFREAIIENGGDIFMKIDSPSTISVYAGASPLSDRIGLIIKPEDTPLSVCCSSGTVGHSFSFGNADAAVIACRSGAQADAYATASCNAVKNASMVSEVTQLFLLKPEIISVVIIKDDKVGIGGKLEVKILDN